MQDVKNKLKDFVLRKLKTTEVKAFRQQQWADQKGICPLCKQYIEPGQDVADHKHSDGKMRQTLHRTCNLILGKWENGLKRYCIDDTRARNIAENISDYIHNTQDILHPTHKTLEEKIELQKKRRNRAKKNKNNSR